MVERDDRVAVIATVMDPTQANGYGNVHGGEIMKLMDSAAACAAMKYSRANVVTARADEIQFLHPVRLEDFVTCTATVVYVGRTSLEVFVTVEVEDLRHEGSERRALSAYFTMVALGDDGRPTPVRLYSPETPEEIAQWHEVAARRAEDRARRGQAVA
jgi:uncharacterized protein (TIGR00369 family)